MSRASGELRELTRRSINPQAAHDTEPTKLSFRKSIGNVLWNFFIRSGCYFHKQGNGNCGIQLWPQLGVGGHGLSAE